jgi:transcriptional regulator with XRE-family HTH domain
MSKTDINKYLKDLGNTLKQIREERGISEKEMTDVMRLPEIASKVIDNGKLSLTLLSLIHLSDFLDIPLKELLPDPADLAD